MERGAFFVGLLLAFASFAALPAAAQPIQYGHTWGGSGLEFGQAIATDSSGNVYLFGNSIPFESNRSFLFLAKFDSTGALLWDRLIDAGSALIPVTAIDAGVDSDGNVVFLAQRSLPTGDVEPLLGKVSPAGDLRFLKAIRGFGYANRLGVDPATGVAVIVGYWYGYGTGVVASFDGSGNLLWARMASSEFASPWAVAFDGSGATFVYLDRPDTVALAKFDAGGNLAKQLILPTTGTGAWQYTWDLAMGRDGFLYALGFSVPYGSYGDVFLAKFDRDLNPIWTERAGSWDWYEEFNRLEATPDGTLVAAGSVANASSWGEWDRGYTSSTRRDAFSPRTSSSREAPLADGTSQTLAPGPTERSSWSARARARRPSSPVPFPG